MREGKQGRKEVTLTKANQIVVHVAGVAQRGRTSCHDC